ncbi:MAG TPA: nitrile hydratase subunit beta [Aestuariivirgaceae bacterium]|nr:nitrile hydratase subunit beta [Aestuariivirgaceae bacterium]
MNGVHDMGGLMGFGPVAPETDEPVFHEPWERRAFGLTLSVGAAGLWNLDITRHTRETLPPAQYLASTYYEIWIAAMTRLILRYGLVTPEEVETGRMREPARQVKGKLNSGEVAAVVARGGSCRRPAASRPAYGAGDRVRARNVHPREHTRLPRYVRGHVGEVVRVHGTFIFPDSNAQGRGPDPQWLYAVRFEGRELWGESRRDSVTLDLWEPYLEAP